MKRFHNAWGRQAHSLGERIAGGTGIKDEDRCQSSLRNTQKEDGWIDESGLPSSSLVGLVELRSRQVLSRQVAIERRVSIEIEVQQVARDLRQIEIYKREGRQQEGRQQDLSGRQEGLYHLSGGRDRSITGRFHCALLLTAGVTGAPSSGWSIHTSSHFLA